MRKRKKGPSKQFREKFGHTPLSDKEEIPWRGKRLIVGNRHSGHTSGNGRSPSGGETARCRAHCGPTAEVCQLLEEVIKGEAYTILHCTC